MVLPQIFLYSKHVPGVKQTHQILASISIKLKLKIISIIMPIFPMYILHLCLVSEENPNSLCTTEAEA